MNINPYHLPPALRRAIAKASGLSRSTIMTAVGGWTHASKGELTETSRQKLLAGYRKLQSAHATSEGAPSVK